MTHEIADNRVVWLQVTKGAVSVNDKLLEAGDGAAISNETRVAIEYADIESNLETEILLFDLAK